jgi:hypothetical protein
VTGAGEALSLSPEAVAILVEGLFARGAAFRFRAGGHSMHPWIRNGDVLTLVPLSPEGPAVGDVTLALDTGSGRLLAHRVVARRGGGCLLKGDRLAKADGMFPVSGLLGKVSEVHRNGKRVRFGQGGVKRILAWMSRKRIKMTVSCEQ